MKGYYFTIRQKMPCGAQEGITKRAAAWLQNLLDFFMLPRPLFSLIALG